MIFQRSVYVQAKLKMLYISKQLYIKNLKNRT